MGSAQSNTMWSSRVLSLLKDGFGAEDIAVIMKSDIASVRREVEILREEGTLAKIYGDSP